MLGVRGVGVNKAAGSLRKRELISYSRGVITILVRSGLEAAACGCYLADKKAYDRIRQLAYVPQRTDCAWVVDYPLRAGFTKRACG